MRNRLVERLKKHDEKALAHIIEQQSRFVVSVIYNTSKGSLSKEDIEEVTADVFVTLWNNADKAQESKLKVNIYLTITFCVKLCYFEHKKQPH